jgi:hypothetical protein
MITGRQMPDSTNGESVKLSGLKKCELCDKLFVAKKESVRFCSRHCCNRWVNSIKIKRVELTCHNCEVKFKRKPHLVKSINFCSRKCYDESRPKKVKLRCFACGKSIERVPKEIKEKNFCSAECQANAPKINTQCATCGKNVTRRITQTFENKTGNYYCSRACLYRAQRKNGLTHQLLLQKNYYILRNKALEKINSEKRCVNCGCDIAEILEINHKNGGGKEEIKYVYKGNNISFLRDIALGTRQTSDLEIRCKVCNILHYVETIMGIGGYHVKYEKPSLPL